MAGGRLIALEWDDREARFAVATPRGSEIVIEDAFAIDISAAAGDEASSNVVEIGRRIAEALSQRDLRGCDALVGLGRTSIELRSLSLPQGPPEEIPDMVRFQALQAFTAVGDDWPLDYVELGEQGGTINVLAAVLSPKQVGQMRQVCAASELTPLCLVLRPFAAASLLHRAGVLRDGKSALIIDMLADGADLTAVADGQVTFMRTVRLPATSDEAVQVRALLGEVRRTIAATQAQEGGERIERIVICGSADEHPLLVQSLAESLQLEVIPFDPFQVVQVASRMPRQALTDAGRYAPLLGMLADHAAGIRHAIDFLNPRKRPAPPSRRRRNLLIVSGAATAILLATGGIVAGLKSYDYKIAKLNEQMVDLNQGVERAKTLIAKADAIKDFTDGDITLLDELYELSQRIPDADHLRLDDVTFSTANVKRGAVINLKGHAKNPDVIASLEDSLRFADNVVGGHYGTIDKNQREYPWLFDTSVMVKPDRSDNGVSTGRPDRSALRASVESPKTEQTKSAVTSQKETAGDQGASLGKNAPSAEKAQTTPDTQCDPAAVGPAAAPAEPTPPMSESPVPSAEPADSVSPSTGPSTPPAEPPTTSPAGTPTATPAVAPTTPVPSEDPTPPATAPPPPDPADTDPADTDPADTDPADTDPADTDPADTDPATADPVPVPSAEDAALADKTEVN